MRRFLLIILYLVIFLAVDIVIAWRMNPDAHTPQEAIEKGATQIVAQAVAQTMKVRMNLPQKVDDVTELLDVQADRGKVTYVMEIEAKGTEFNQIMREITTNMQENGCKRKDYRKMLSFGLTVSISIHAEDGQQAAPITFAPETCGIDKHWLRLQGDTP